MGMDIHIRIAKYNSATNLFEEIRLYRPGETYKYNEKGEKIVIDPNFERVWIDAGRDYEMFEQIKEGTEDENGNSIYFPSYSVAFNSLEENFKNDLLELYNSIGFFDFSEINLADFAYYCNEHPTVVDYDDDKYEWGVSDKPKPTKKNPLIDLFQQIINYISIYEAYHWVDEPLRYYKVIFYFDN